ncbi:MAG: 3-deoxy-manno-octulosonate cytidylyltransferase [Pseudomonadota bacterium]
MTAAIIIPARYASTRLPGKPLLAETGRPLIAHVYERAAAAKDADRVIVATDDERILKAVRDFGGEAVMTRADHASGSERAAEAAADIDADIIVNVQGDEPEIEPAAIDLLIDTQRRSGAFASTLVCPFAEGLTEGPGSPTDPSCVKAVLSSEKDGLRHALYFSRALAPYPRADGGAVRRAQDWRLHLGVYAFSRDSLMRFAAAPPGRLEQVESLEQLRILEMGERIAVALVDKGAPGVDTPEDYAAFVKRALG